MGLENLLTVEDGARLYVEYYEEHKEKSRSITGFFMRYDVENKKFFSGNDSGCLNKHYDKFNRLRRDGKLPKGIITIEDWIKSLIPRKLKQRLEKLTGKYLREYSLEEGVKFYIRHLKEHKEESKPITIFFVRYDVENNTFHPGNNTGNLNKHYDNFLRLRRYGKLPEGITALGDWIKSLIPKKLKQRLKELTEKYLKEYSLEQGVEFYIQHLEEHKEESKSVKSFFRYYDAKNEFSDEPKSGQLSKYYTKFRELKNNGKLPEGITTIEGWIGLQIPRKLKRRLEKLTEKYLKEYSLEEGVEFYIRHLEECKEESKPMVSFFRKYNVENKGFHSGNITGNLNKHYDKFNRLRGDRKLPEGITTLEDYLISQLPEEKRGRAEYYLRGQFLKDVAKAKVDTDRLKEVVLG